MKPKKKAWSLSDKNKLDLYSVTYTLGRYVYTNTGLSLINLSKQIKRVDFQDESNKKQPDDIDNVKKKKGLVAKPTLDSLTPQLQKHNFLIKDLDTGRLKINYKTLIKELFNVFNERLGQDKILANHILDKQRINAENLERLKEQKERKLEKLKLIKIKNNDTQEEINEIKKILMSINSKIDLIKDGHLEDGRKHMKEFLKFNADFKELNIDSITDDEEYQLNESIGTYLYANITNQSELTLRKLFEKIIFDDIKHNMLRMNMDGDYYCCSEIVSTDKREFEFNEIKRLYEYERFKINNGIFFIEEI